MPEMDEFVSPSGLFVIANASGEILVAIPKVETDPKTDAPTPVFEGEEGQTIYEVDLPNGAWSEAGLDLSDFRFDFGQNQLVRGSSE